MARVLLRGSGGGAAAPAAFGESLFAAVPPGRAAHTVERFAEARFIRLEERQVAVG